jgi:hypothetical protein
VPQALCCTNNITVEYNLISTSEMLSVAGILFHPYRYAILSTVMQFGVKHIDQHSILITTYNRTIDEKLSTWRA